MAGATTHASTADRQTQWTPDFVREWIWEAIQVVSEIAVETDLVFDSIGLGHEARSHLRALLTQQSFLPTP